MLPFAAKNVAQNGAFTAWDAHPLGWALVAYVGKKSLSLTAETMPISLRAFASFSKN